MTAIDLKVQTRRIYTNTAEATQAFGFFYGQLLQPNQIVALFGDLGAGKTTLLKGMICGAAGVSPDSITSPTFTYLHTYPGTIPTYHFDLFRISCPEEFSKAGFAEYFFMGGICFLEWSEKIEPILPSCTLRIELTHEGGDRRSISIPI